MTPLPAGRPTTRPAGSPSQQELPHEDELLEQDDELLPHEEDELLHDDELLPHEDELLSQDDDALPHDAPAPEPPYAAPMTYQDEDASWDEPALALDRDPLPREPPTRPPVVGHPGPGPRSDALLPRSSYARRQARRIIHVHRVATPTATPTRTNRISMFSP